MAVALQCDSRALSALADRWEHVDARRVEALSPYQGADDLNAPEALRLDGILFMVGNAEPAETLRCRMEFGHVSGNQLLRISSVEAHL